MSPQAADSSRLTLTEYLVLPVEPRETREPTTITDGAQRCRYYTPDWQPRSARELVVDPGTADFVALMQAPPEQVPAQVLLDLVREGLRPDVGVGLFAAVVKTLDQEHGGLPNTFVATGDPQAAQVLLPVRRGTTRGVILVFRRPALGATAVLVASTDPEIKNGTN
jgi:hypothetical protein